MMSGFAFSITGSGLVAITVSATFQCLSPSLFPFSSLPLFSLINNTSTIHKKIILFKKQSKTSTPHATRDTQPKEGITPAKKGLS